ncbi:hypothetical protein QL285_010568 [Trifolium repens]|nr:hypothetical protein QL285_010568 [Trifolium repens]
MARTHQMHGSTTSQSSSSISGEGSPPPPHSNAASVTSTSPIRSLGSYGFVPGTTMPITTMAFHSISSGYRPPPMVTNPLYGYVPTPTMGFQSIPTSEPEIYTSPRVTPTPLTTASCSGLENHFHFSYNEVAIDVYLSRKGKGKYHENLGLGSGVGYARGKY